MYIVEVGVEVGLVCCGCSHVVNGVMPMGKLQPEHSSCSRRPATAVLASMEPWRSGPEVGVADPVVYPLNKLVASPFFPFLDCFLATRSGVGSGASLICRSDPRWIACRADEDQGWFNKSARRITCFASTWSCVPLAGRGGEGRKRRYCVAKWFVLQKGAPHAVDKLAVAFYGQNGGRSSVFNLQDGGPLDLEPELDVSKQSSGSSPAAARLPASAIVRR